MRKTPIIWCWIALFYTSGERIFVDSFGGRVIEETMIGGYLNLESHLPAKLEYYNPRFERDFRTYRILKNCVHGNHLRLMKI